MLKRKPRTPLKWKKKCEMKFKMYHIKWVHERRDNLQWGKAPLLVIFSRQETRNVLHLVNSSSIFLNFSSLKENKTKEKVSAYWLQKYLSALKVAQNSFQHFPRCRFWWVTITTLYQKMLQSWYRKTAQSLVNTLVLFSWQNRLPQQHYYLQKTP